MAPLPKRKQSGQKGRVRANALRLIRSQSIACPSCKKSIRPHSVCPYCGYYKGKAIIVKKEKKRDIEAEHEDTK